MIIVVIIIIITQSVATQRGWFTKHRQRTPAVGVLLLKWCVG